MRVQHVFVRQIARTQCGDEVHEPVPVLLDEVRQCLLIGIVEWITDFSEYVAVVVSMWQVWSAVTIAAEIRAAGGLCGRGRTAHRHAITAAASAMSGLRVTIPTPSVHLKFTGVDTDWDSEGFGGIGAVTRSSVS